MRPCSGPRTGILSMKRFSLPFLAAISAAVVFSLSSATASPLSLNQDNRYRSFDEIFSSTAVPGALTMESFQTFDFRTAGVGSSVFRRSARVTSLLAGSRFEAREDYATSYNETYQPAGAFDIPKFTVTSVSSPIFGPLDTTNTTSGPVSGGYPGGFTAMPEPTTWVAGVLTLLAIAYTQRRRLRRSVTLKA
jgi:hypothetical protein